MMLMIADAVAAARLQGPPWRLAARFAAIAMSKSPVAAQSCWKRRPTQKSGLSAVGIGSPRCRETAALGHIIESGCEAAFACSGNSVASSQNCQREVPKSRF
jgi:hypothetical protein